MEAAPPSGYLAILPGYPAGAVITGGGSLAAGLGVNLGSTFGGGLQGLGSPGHGPRAVTAGGVAPSASGAGQGTTHAVGQNKGGPPVTKGKIIPGEPITDPKVRRALRDMYRRSNPESLQAHEEGVTLKGYTRNGQRVFSDPQRWKPGNTLEEIRRTKNFQAAQRPDPGYGARQYVFGHSHPWKEGTELFRNAAGVRNVAGAGPSWGDVGALVIDRDLGRNALDYVVSPEGIYRIMGSENIQWIAPLKYLSTP